MPQITISDQVYQRVLAFKPVVECVLEVSMETDSYIELLLRLTPDYMMSEFFGGADTKALIGLMQRIGQAHPEFFSSIAETLRAQEVQSVEAQRKAELKSNLGFPEPPPEQ